MKFKSIIILSSIVFLLSGCGLGSKYEPIIANVGEPEWDTYFSNEELFELYKEKVLKNEVVSEILNVEMDGEYKDKELFVLSHNSKNTYFRVYSYDKGNNSFKKLFEKKSSFDKNKPYFIQGVSPFYANETEHILIGQNLNPNMIYYYFLIGKTPESKKVTILIDNALNESAQAAFNGEGRIGDTGIAITSDGGLFQFYSQTDIGYQSMKNHTN